jgi:hypothetical protein
MSAIANQWTGNGLADDTAISSANVATAGNFSGTTVTWTRGVSSSPAPTLFTTKFNGIAFTSNASTAAVGDIRGTFGSALQVRSQEKITVGDISSAAADLLQTRVSSAGARAAGFLIDASRLPYFNNSSNTTIGSKGPALAIGDVILVDMIVIQDASATSTNGRIIGRVKNLTNTAWNTTGEYFIDSLYTTNTGTGGLTQVYGGQNGGGILGATNTWYFEFIGCDTVSVATSDTSATAAKAYFADAPTISAPLATPVVTLLTKTTPTTVGGSDGTQQVSWPNVSGAVSYDAYVANSSTPAQEDFVRVGTNVGNGPYTFTGLAAGTHAYGIKAKAS